MDIVAAVDIAKVTVAVVWIFSFVCHHTLSRGEVLGAVLVSALELHLGWGRGELIQETARV